MLDDMSEFDWMTYDIPNGIISLEENTARHLLRRHHESSENQNHLFTAQLTYVAISVKSVQLVKTTYHHKSIR